MLGKLLTPDLPHAIAHGQKHSVVERGKAATRDSGDGGGIDWRAADFCHIYSDNFRYKFDRKPNLYDLFKLWALE